MTRITFALAAAVALSTLAASAANAQKPQEANKKIVVDFYDKALNPNAPDGPDGLKGFIQFLKEKFPNSRSEIKRVFADGDYVIVHVHAVREPGTRGNAVVDIFKLENGKVVEHWDVVQPIPDKAANNNGMF